MVSAPVAAAYVGAIRIVRISQPSALMAERSSLANALSDRYEIEREAGAGGMATVYLARDIRHARQVALKVLHPDLAAALGPERFLAEIRTTANLQHPHILPLHDSGDANGFLFYVMPFVAGESLRQRLERETQLPIDDAVRITREVLSALDYAHRHGIVHRDIKPENILLHDGAALVADFGIALAVQQAGTQRMTQTGLSLGTPHYMSPEQAMGEKNVDGRADIYAAGAVLYEMLTGEPPFTGASTQAIVAKVMTERPMSPRTVRDTIPSHVETAVMRALAKLPADRFATAKQFADALEGRETADTAAEVARGSFRAPSAGRRALPWLAGIALGLLLGGGAALQWRASHTASPETVRFTVEPPPGMALYDGIFERPFALSADGRSILFTAGPKAALYLRRLDQLAPTRVMGVDRPIDFHFSPDGETVAYTPAASARNLKTIKVGAAETNGGTTIFADSAPQFFAWTHAQDIFYSDTRGIFRVSSRGGVPRRIVARDTSDWSWFIPSILEDGRTLAFRAQQRGKFGEGGGQLRVVSADGLPVTKVDLEVQGVLGFAKGFLMYGVRDGRIMGVPFDLKARAVRGEPVTLLEGVVSPIWGLSASLGDNGTLAYMSGVSTTRVDIVDEHGTTMSTLPLEPRRLMGVEWSPDGTRILIQSGPLETSDLWVYDVATRIATRLTQNARVQAPEWTPDGKRVAFMGWDANGGIVIMWLPADGSAPAEPIAVAAAAGVKRGFLFSPDGKYLLALTSQLGKSKPASPILAVPLAGGPGIPLLSGVKVPFPPHVSPDGHWMAYSSEEGERREVYIRPFPSGSGRLQLSQNGGDSPQWSADGRRIIYRAPGSYRVATLDVSGALPRLVRDDSLFADAERREFSVHPDGKRFAMLRDGGERPRLIVVTHWLDEALAKLRQR